MRLSIVKKEDGFAIIEEGRIIYYIREEKEQELLSISLLNMYKDETLGLFQIQPTWIDRLKKKKAIEFTLYDKEVKLGELHKNKNGYELTYGDAIYRFFGGMHIHDFQILCFDRLHQIAEFAFHEEEGSVRFHNESANALFALLLYVFQQHIDPSCFLPEAFVQNYRGVYDDNAR